MAATFVIEIGLAIYTLWRYRHNLLTKLAVAMLVCLAIFQAAEFVVCGREELAPLVWSRIGYAAITLLPALGLHLAYEVTKAKRRPLVLPAYGLALGFVVFFLVVPQALTGNQCLGNYVIFQAAPWAVPYYTAYYYGFLGLTMLLSLIGAQKLSKPKQKQASYGFLASYLIFIVPAFTVWALDHKVVSGLPSIMCGFAVLFALVLVLYVMPRAGLVRSKSGR